MLKRIWFHVSVFQVYVNPTKNVSNGVPSDQNREFQLHRMDAQFLLRSGCPLKFKKKREEKLKPLVAKLLNFTL